MADESPTTRPSSDIRWNRVNTCGDSSGFPYYFDEFVLPSGESVCILRTRENDRPFAVRVSKNERALNEWRIGVSMAIARFVKWEAE